MILQQKSLEIPITSKALEIAEQFASQQPHPQNQEIVRLNTLAVLAVHDYLELMAIDTELSESDSWNPVVRLCEDVGDLMVRGFGKLECRPLLPDSRNRSIYHLPPEVCSERIGYVVVEINSERKRATLLGFTPTVVDEQLQLTQLQPLTDLLEHLESLTQSQVDLSQWLNNIFPSSWQEIEAVFSVESETTISPDENQPSSKLGQWLEQIVDTVRNIWTDLSGSQRPQLEVAGAFRGFTSVNNLLPECEVMRAKLIDLGVQLGSQNVVLLLALTQESDLKLRITVQMYPRSEQEYLPDDLKLVLLSSSGEMIQEVTSRTQDRGIQLKPFKIPQNTNFQLVITLGDFSLSETFNF